MVNHYQSENLAVGTLKNRLSVLRWWANKLGRSQVVASTNEHYGIGARQLVAKASKAKILEPEKHHQISCRYIQISLALQAVFGLRLEESIKFQLRIADKQDHI